MLNLLVDTSSLTRSKMGTISGVVYFETATGFFPAKDWTDLALAFVRVWAEALIRVADGIRTQTVWFMDGPYGVEISHSASKAVQLAFVRNGLHARVTMMSAEAELSALLQNAASVAHEMVAACQQKGWSDGDTKALASFLNHRLQ